MTAVKRVLALQDGPSILVAHSYGGAVVTEAGSDLSVAGLVYVAAHMPDAGESEAGEGKLFPSDLSKSTALKTTADGFTYLDPSQFHAYFAADLPADKAAFMASSQVFNLAVSFKAVITKAAWRTSRAGWLSLARTERSIPTWNGFMPSGQTARKPKSLERVIASTYRTLKKWQM